ncbi:MAG: hypothetical protein MK010_09425, partial [Erythrobacter sp.]|nr:hypothetical protein [Erythrobacter sp.]
MNATEKRGQPLVAIVSLIVGYTVLRTAFWTPMLEAIPAPLTKSVGIVIGAVDPAPPVFAATNKATSFVSNSQLQLRFGADHARDSASATDRLPLFKPSVGVASYRLDPFGLDARERGRLMQSAGRLSMPIRPIAFANLASDVSSELQTRVSESVMFGFRPVERNRLLGDAWLFARMDGASSATAAPQSANYGRSQGGAVIRYAIAPGSPREPDLYGRIVFALAGPTQQDAAIGVSARPLADLPLRLHAEARMTRQGEGALREMPVRPSIFVTASVFAEHPGTSINTRGYGQAGYVGGRAATAFADGQMVVERAVARFDLGEV